MAIKSQLMGLLLFPAAAPVHLHRSSFHLRGKKQVLRLVSEKLLLIIGPKQLRI